MKYSSRAHLPRVRIHCPQRSHPGPRRLDLQHRCLVVMKLELGAAISAPLYSPAPKLPPHQHLLRGAPSHHGQSCPQVPPHSPPDNGGIRQSTPAPPPSRVARSA
ncbi:hypothetical protein XELAEV_18046266mg [Xenopus laevis]|uniref:Uncharacterized protein n=1 Tax=Xenopus laevis TaxID=8355 RepID=A0A974BSV5_XENLA|nr:hypothetical protein XELAEV_18046266mg [Xenopus laevis]